LKSYFYKWAAASLVAPAVTFIFIDFIKANMLAKIVLIFWPTSIILMGLENTPMYSFQTFFTVAVAILANVLIYLSLGLLVNWLINAGRSTTNGNS
jgi:putative effector of murein hydrolase LrgA (UPF0299 family)